MLKACKRLRVHLSNLVNRSGAVHKFDSFSSVFLQRVVNDVSNIMTVRNSADIPTIHIRFLVLAVRIAVLNLKIGCTRFLPHDQLTFHVISSYWTLHKTCVEYTIVKWATMLPSEAPRVVT